MAFIGMIIAPCALLFPVGLVLLILGAFLKTRRKRLLTVGCVFCAPLSLFFLITVAGSLIFG